MGKEIRNPVEPSGVDDFADRMSTWSVELWQSPNMRLLLAHAPNVEVGELGEGTGSPKGFGRVRSRQIGLCFQEAGLEHSWLVEEFIVRACQRFCAAAIISIYIYIYIISPVWSDFRCLNHLKVLNPWSLLCLTCQPSHPPAPPGPLKIPKQRAIEALQQTKEVIASSSAIDGRSWCVLRRVAGWVAGGCWDDDITSDDWDHSRKFPA